METDSPARREEVHTGSILYHFFPHEPLDRGLSVLRSIVDRGLLMSRATGDLIDRFPVVGDRGVEHLHIGQNARVCFTDIPEDLIGSHGNDYGRFAVGFRRETVMQWGGCPVWYLPNHLVENTLQGQSGFIIKGLSRAEKSLEMFGTLLGTDEIKKADIQFTRGPEGRPTSFDDVLQELGFAREALLRMATFFKQMSSLDEDDHRFLYEREWRIVRGVSFGDPGEVYRPLTDDEVAELTELVPAWGEPARSADGIVREGEPLVRTFRFFNGLPGGDTVAASMCRVLVPEQGAAEAVEALFDERREAFGPTLPTVGLLPA